MSKELVLRVDALAVAVNSADVARAVPATVVVQVDRAIVLWAPVGRGGAGGAMTVAAAGATVTTDAVARTVTIKGVSADGSGSAVMFTMANGDVDGFEVRGCGLCAASCVCMCMRLDVCISMHMYGCMGVWVYVWLCVRVCKCECACITLCVFVCMDGFSCAYVFVVLIVWELMCMCGCV